MNTEIDESTKRITAAVDNLRSALNSELSRLELSLKNQSGDIHLKVAERKHLACKLGLDKKLCEIYDEIRYYPNWSKSDEWISYRRCEIDNPSLEEKEKEKIIRFDLNKKSYQLIYRDEGSSTAFEGDYFHHTQLKLLDASGKCLIGINISVEFDDIVELKPFDVDAFLPGDWIQDVLECYERYQSNKKRKDIEEKYEQSKVDDLKNKFGLD